MNNDDRQVDGGALLAAVQAVAISPGSAKDFVRQLKRKAKEASPNASERELQETVADKIISRYTWLASTSGALSAAPGIVPGVGTAIAVATALGDATVCMKLQLDMAICLAEAFDYDVNNEDARHLALLVSAGAAVESVGERAAAQVASKAGVRMVQQYLKGAALQAVKELFKRLGIVFTRKALERAIPFGIGVVVGAAGNYALTKYVGYQAKKWFIIDRDEK